MCSLGVPSFFVVLGIILACGLLGGVRNWAIERDNSSPAPVWVKMIEGVIASATIPLFLSIIGSEKISPAFGDIRIWETEYQQAIFILVGFCGLASLFSQKFLASMAKQLDQLGEKVERVKEQSNALADLQTEPDQSEVRPSAIAPTHPEQTPANSKKVLEALGTGQFLMRSKTGLRETTGLDADQVATALTELRERGYVRLIDTPKGDRWALTDDGRLAMASL